MKIETAHHVVRVLIGGAVVGGLVTGATTMIGAAVGLGGAKTLLETWMSSKALIKMGKNEGILQSLEDKLTKEIEARVATVPWEHSADLIAVIGGMILVSLPDGNDLVAAELKAEKALVIMRSKLGVLDAEQNDALPTYDVVVLTVLEELLSNNALSDELTMHVDRALLGCLSDIARTGKDNESLIKILVSEIKKLRISVEAKESGITEFAIIQLAKRISQDVTSVREALIALENAVSIVIKGQKAGELPSEETRFVAEVLKRAAELNRVGEFEAAELVLASARKEARSKRDSAIADEIRILRSSEEQAILRRDVKAFAEFTIERIELENEKLDALSLTAVANKFSLQGHEQGVSFDIEVAQEIAHRALNIAEDGNEKANVFHVLGICAHSLGKWQVDVGKISEAIRLHKLAAKQIEDLNDGSFWARIHHHLGIELRDLAQETKKTHFFEEALAAFEEAQFPGRKLVSRTEWIGTQNSLAGTHRMLADELLRSGKRTKSINSYQEAILAYSESINVGKIFDRDDLIIISMSFGNRGIARKNLALASHDTSLVNSSLSDCNMALEILQQVGSQKLIFTAVAQLAEVEIGLFRLVGDFKLIKMAQAHANQAHVAFEKLEVPSLVHWTTGLTEEIKRIFDLTQNQGKSS